MLLTATETGPARRLMGDDGGGPNGYVLPMFALLLLPVLGFTALAVDLGSWYSYAARMEAAADAAALGGVVYLPDEGLAESEAREVAARNGFEHGVNGITVDVTNLGDQRLKVTINDIAADQYFSQLFTPAVDVERASVSQYVLPVRMGSPRNFLGTGNDPSNNIPSGAHENYWLAASGPCAGVENGDLLLGQTDRNYVMNNPNPASGNPGPVGAGISWSACTGGNTVANPDYDAEGYYYAIDVPEGYTGGSVTIQLFDAPQCTDRNSDNSFTGYPASLTGDGVDGGLSNNAANHRTRYQMRNRDLTPYEPSDNPPIGTVREFTMNQNSNACGNSGSDWQGKWMDFHTLAAPVPGVYFLQVSSNDPSLQSAERHVSNSFSIRANPGGGAFEPCTSSASTVVTGVPESANCVNVFAAPNMSILANFSGSQSEFFLADIGPEHSGKTLEISLFDPGEGSRALELIQPNNVKANFEWEIVNQSGTDTAPTDGWSGNATNFTAAGFPIFGINTLGNDPQNDCRGWNPQPGSFRGSRSKYSDRKLRLTLDLPDDIAAAYGGNTWWRVRYTTGGTGCAPTDRTTWTVRVIGDPVRLIPDPG